jgi:hypothetical protein
MLALSRTIFVYKLPHDYVNEFDLSSFKWLIDANTLLLTSYAQPAL